MFDAPIMVTLADAERSHDFSSDPVPLSKQARIIGRRDLVGVQTQLIAQSQDTIYDFAIKIDRACFDFQRYAYLDGKLYVIGSLSKAKEPTKMLLNVSVDTMDADIKTAIETWIGAL